MSEPKTKEELIKAIEFIRLGIENAKLWRKSKRLKLENIQLRETIEKLLIQDEYDNKEQDLID